MECARGRAGARRGAASRYRRAASRSRSSRRRTARRTESSGSAGACRSRATALSSASRSPRPRSRRTARAVRGRGYDLVHVHEPMLPAACLTAIAAARVPLVATFHMFRQELLWYRVFRRVVRAAAARLEPGSPSPTQHVLRRAQRAGSLGRDPERDRLRGALGARRGALRPADSLLGRPEPRRDCPSCSRRSGGSTVTRSSFSSARRTTTASGSARRPRRRRRAPPRARGRRRALRAVTPRRELRRRARGGDGRRAAGRGVGDPGLPRRARRSRRTARPTRRRRRAARCPAGVAGRRRRAASLRRAQGDARPRALRGPASPSRCLRFTTG